MKALVSEESRNNEVEYIREDVSHKFAALRKRLSRWKTGTITLGGGAIFLITGGILLLVMGQLPESIELVSPAVEAAQGSDPFTGAVNPEFAPVIEAMNDVVGGVFGRVIAMFMIIMGIAQGLRRQSIVAFAMGPAAGIALYSLPQVMESIFEVNSLQVEPTPFAQIETQLDNAIDDGDWARAWQLLEPISASKKDLAMLKSQVAYQAGNAEESLRIINTRELADPYPEKVWVIESRFAQNNIETHFQMSEESLQYAEDQDDLRSQGWSMLRTSIPFGVLALGAGLISLMLKRNVAVINEWVAPTISGDEQPAIFNKKGEPVDATSVGHASRTGNQQEKGA